MRTQFKTVGRALAVGATAIALLAAGPTPSEASSGAADAGIAADRCTGTLVESKPISIYGTLNLYWNGTYNCAEAVSNSSTWGDPKYMSAYIESCSTAYKGRDFCPSSATIDSDFDANTYRYWAGPVRVDGRGVCVRARGNIYREWFADTKVGHC